MGKLQFTYNPLSWSFTLNVDEQGNCICNPLSDYNGVGHSIGDS